MYTVPGNSAVSVDGRLLGTSNETGLLQIPRVDWGTHTFVVTHDGYRTASESIEVRGPRGARLVLVNEAEAARQEAEARLREIEVHLDRARAYFRNGQYQDATDECDAVLRIEANNAAAIALKKQIEQTRKILG